MIQVPYSLETALAVTPPIIPNTITVGPGGGGGGVASVVSTKTNTPGVGLGKSQDYSKGVWTSIENFQMGTSLSSLFSGLSPLEKVKKIETEKPTISPNNFAKIYIISPLVTRIK